MEIGIKGHAEVTVDKTNVASSVGSGLLDVFSTPSMIALMEKACKESVVSYLEQGQGTVGIRLEVDHLAAVPIGLEVDHLAAVPIGEKVWVDSELIAVDKRVLTFATTAWSRKEKIGEGIHKRCIIFDDRFLEKMRAKYE